MWHRIIYHHCCRSLSLGMDQTRNNSATFKITFSLRTVLVIELCVQTSKTFLPGVKFLRPAVFKHLALKSFKRHLQNSVFDCTFSSQPLNTLHKDLFYIIFMLTYLFLTVSAAGLPLSGQTLFIK